MAFENLCMYCFEENGGADVCPHCGRDARAAVPQIQLLPGTLVYNERFLIGRALGQDSGGIVYSALDTKKNVKIRIREYLPRDCARRLNSGEVVPEPGSEDRFDSGMSKLRASVEGVEDPSKRHFFFEENGTGYIAQRKNGGAAGFGGGSDDEGDHRGARMAMVVGVAAVLVLAVAVGVIALVNYFTSSTDKRTEAPATTGLDIWQAPETPTPTPYAAATFAAITDPTHSWMEFTNPDLSGNASDFATPSPAPTPEGGLGDITINSKSDPELIKKLQKLLVDLGWLDESGITGKYDDATRQAVKDFQQYMNDTYAIDPKLEVDGIAGKKTITWLMQTDIAMKPTPTPAPVTPSPTQAGQLIDENSSPEEIKYVQLQLMRLGILSEGDVDGKYGKTTKEGVKAFQMRVNDLLGYDAVNEDGVCDDRTLAYLDYYVDWWQDNQPTPAPTQQPTPAPTEAPTIEPDESKGDVIDENANPASIKRVQEMLITLGYLDGEADGSYGKKTYAAVEAFQQYIKDNVDPKIDVTGKCDVLTREYLERYSEMASAETPEPAAGAPVINVSDAKQNADGVYVVTESGVRISWTAEGVSGFCVELTDRDGNVLNKEDNTPYTALTLNHGNLSAEQPYKFIVTSLNGDGSRGESAHVWLIAEKAETGEPAAVVPEITVTGALSYADGVYRIGEEGAGLMWSAAGAEAYSIYITDSYGDIIYSNRNDDITEFELTADSMTPGEKYTFTIVAIPEGGTEDDGGSASVSLMLDGQTATAEPTAEPSTDFGAPVITVEALGEMEGVYFVGDTSALISWQAEGEVRAYSIYLTNSAGDSLAALTETDKQSMAVDPATMTDGEIYTLRVIAIPVNGFEEHGKSAQVQIMLYDGRTPEPTEEPVAQIGQIGIVVSGHTANDGDTYYAGNDGMTIAWSAEGDVAGYDVLVVDSNGETIIDREGVTNTSMTVNPGDLAEDVVYTFTVTAVPKGGSAEDGNSASVAIIRASAPEVGGVVITVSGHESEEDGVYYIGEAPLTIEWQSENAAAYSIYLTDADDNVINSVENTAETMLTMGGDGLEPGMSYIITVRALSASGKDEDAKTASVFIAVKEEEKPQIGVTEITVDGHIDVQDGVYITDETGISVSWYAENAVSYSVAIFDAENTEVKRVDGTNQTSLDIDTSAVAANKVYTLYVTPADEDGNKGEGASVQIMRYEAEPTPEPTAEPVEIGKPNFAVEGHADEQEGIYIAGENAIVISWNAENAVSYSIGVYDSANEVINSAEKQDITEMTVEPAGLPEGEVITIAVKGHGADGEEGEVAYVQLMLPKAEPTPEPTAEPTPEPVEIGKPNFVVEGHADEQEGIYIVGDQTVIVSWNAENASVYSVAVYDSAKEVITSAEKQDITEMKIDPANMPAGEVITVAVKGYGEDGTESEAASVQLMLPKAEPTPEPTAEPTPEPVEIGKPNFVVEGHADEQEGIYIVGDQTVIVSWNAENASVYSVAVYDSAKEVITSAEKQDITEMKIDPANMPAGEVITIAVKGYGEDGTESEAASVQLMLPKAEPTPEPTAEPTPEPVQVGKPSVKVSGHADEKDGVFIAGDEALSITWSAENAATYNVAIYDGNGDAIKSVEGTDVTGLELKSETLAAGETYTLKVTGIGSDGAKGETASVKIAGADDTVKPITPKSDKEEIQALQVQLYSLGWIAEADKNNVEIGKLDAITIQAIYDFQNYVITEELIPEMTLIDVNDPVVDELTITALFDTKNPIKRPAE